jgi:plastocyanin
MMKKGGNTENIVNIKNFAFNPSTLNIKVGTTVTWTNEDSAAHRIKSNKFNSGDLNEGDSFQFTFSEKGTYNYTCAIHPSMQAKIVVE